MNQTKTTFSPALLKATGKIEYGLTNDYMFRVLFQKNKKAYFGFIVNSDSVDNAIAFLRYIYEE